MTHDSSITQEIPMLATGEADELATCVMSRDMVATHAYLIRKMLDCLARVERYAALVAAQERFLAGLATHQESTRGTVAQADPTTLARMRNTYHANDPTWLELTGNQAYWERQAQTYAATASALHGSMDIKMRRRQ